MELFCLLITLAIFSSYYRLFVAGNTKSVVYRLLSASLLTCGQIILSELLLGLFHQLYLSSLVVVNLSVVVLVLAAARRSGRSAGAGALRTDGAHLIEAARSALDAPAAVLAILTAVVYVWILAAAYYLPPRGIDDIAYHLPAVFEYVLSHEIRLLPLDILEQFAFPQNGELLFLWPVMFTHAQRWVAGMNVPFVLLAVLTVYALLRHFSLPKNDSLFVALLYALCPVVLMQAGVNYVDIIVSLFLLLSLFYSLRYREHRKHVDLYLAGLSIGLLCGMKYTALFLALPLQVLIVPSLRKGGWRPAIGYLSVILLAGGWWYLRNAWMLGAPLYPVHLQSRVPEGMVNARGGSALQNIRYNLPYWVARYPLSDSGIGTYDGGFGLVFWGMCLFSWGYVTLRSVLTFSSSGIPKLVALAYLPAGFLLLLVLPPRYVDFDGRLAMFAVAIGLLSFGEVLSIMKDRAYTTIIKVACLMLSVVTISLLFVTDQPSYRIGDAVRDSRNGIKSSEFKYLSGSFGPHADLRSVWELLDLFTRDDRGGLNCRILSDVALYYPSPVYGSQLQNRVLNMSREHGALADAYVLMAPERSVAALAAIPAGDDYVAVLRSGHASLLLKRTIAEQPERQRVLQAYYRAYWPDAIEAAEQLDGRLDAKIPVIATGDMGYAVRAVDMEKGRPGRVHLSFENKEEDTALQKEMERCYTFGRPLTGYRSKKVAQVIYKGRELGVYLNRRT